MNETPVTHDSPPLEAGTDAAMDALRAAGAERFDAVGWHFIVVLAQRAAAQSGRAQALLQGKLAQAISAMQTRMETRMRSTADHPSDTAPIISPDKPATSPLAHLLRDMGHTGLATDLATPARSANAAPTARWRTESPRVRQFRQQLSKISVQKQVTQAIAQAPQNAGPINSHMLVLRSLAVMRDASPDYLNRFMTYLDTLLCLEEAGKTRLATKKPVAKTPKKPEAG
ncbi:MAG: DUF2894 domain-containing protein [Limnohabitans sp.]|nr:DUF2894 domain-containing protein [Limnohabitans sp.]